MRPTAMPVRPLRWIAPLSLMASLWLLPACSPDTDAIESSDIAEKDVGTGGDVAMDGSGLEGGCMSEHLAWGRGGEFMLPGTDCLDCHRVDGDAESVFSIAGTITTSPLCPDPVEGAIVHVLDDAGVAVELVSNEEGNFFTTEALVPPFIVSVERDGHVLPMEFPASHGSCGGCHAEGSPLGFVWALQ